jgi:hypothetical protein
MKRRTFLATLTALVGVALAKIKASGATLRPGVAQITPAEPVRAVRKTLGGLVVFSQNKVWEYSYQEGHWKEWKHPISEKYGRLLTLNDYGVLVDTCKHCGAQAHPGYELICTCLGKPIDKPE